MHHGGSGPHPQQVGFLGPWNGAAQGRLTTQTVLRGSGEELPSSLATMGAFMYHLAPPPPLCPT